MNTSKLYQLIGNQIASGGRNSAVIVDVGRGKYIPVLDVIRSPSTDEVIIKLEAEARG